jgi:hypothetical protein
MSIQGEFSGTARISRIACGIFFIGGPCKKFCIGRFDETRPVGRKDFVIFPDHIREFISGEPERKCRNKDDQDEKTNPEVSNNTNLEKVKISKEITATGEENVFDIHLKVETTEAIAESTVAPDAAVVLVIDASISMNYCPTCGQVMTKQQPHKQGQNTCAGGTLPLDAAKVAAYNFVRNYVGYQKQANGTDETYKNKS